MLFWISLLVFSLFCYALCANRSRFVTNADGNLEIRKSNYSWFIVIIYFAVLTFFAGLRSGIGDTGYYMYGFSSMKHYTLSDYFTLDIEKEKGYRFLLILISYLTDNEQVFLLILSALTIGMIVISICQYSEDVGMSFFLLYATGIYSGTMNGARQYIVAAVIFLMTKFIIENKPINYIVILLLLSTIHTSALFMIPVFFFARKKVWNWSTVIYIAIALFLVMNFSSVLQNSDIWLEDSVYENYVGTLKNDKDYGANIFRVLVMLVPPVLSFLGRKYVDQDEIHYRVYSNILLLNAIVYLFASYNWIFARLAMYLNIYVILFYPYILKRIFDIKSQKFVKLIMIIMYSVFLIFEIRNTPYVSYYLGINKELIGELTRTFY